MSWQCGGQAGGGERESGEGSRPGPARGGWSAVCWSAGQSGLAQPPQPGPGLASTLASPRIALVRPVLWGQAREKLATGGAAATVSDYKPLSQRNVLLCWRTEPSRPDRQAGQLSPITGPHPPHPPVQCPVQQAVGGGGGVVRQQSVRLISLAVVRSESYTTRYSFSSHDPGYLRYLAYCRFFYSATVLSCRRTHPPMHTQS